MFMLALIEDFTAPSTLNCQVLPIWITKRIAILYQDKVDLTISNNIGTFCTGLLYSKL